VGRDGGRGLRRAVGYLRLVHPYPSTLDAVVTGILAAIAGGAPAVALRLAVSMLTIQFGIGALNDLVDADRDRGRARKPITAGLITRRDAVRVAVGAYAIGLGLAATVSLGALVVAAAGGAIGVVYDLRLKGTAWSWLGFALGLPLLPAFAWVGATGSVPGPILVAALTAVPAGFALAVANALPDVDRDRDAGIDSVAVALGRPSAWRLAGLADVAVVLAAAGSFVAFGGTASSMATPVLAGIAGAAAITVAGLVLGRSDAVGRRQRGWELQTIGIGALAAAWTAGLAAAGKL